MRTTIGHARRQSKKRLFKAAKGFRGARSKQLRTVKESLVRAGAFAFRDRRVKKREFRKLWIIREDRIHTPAEQTAHVCFGIDSPHMHTSLQAMDALNLLRRDIL